MGMFHEYSTNIYLPDGDVLPFSFSKDNTKLLFAPWKHGSPKWFKYWFRAYVSGSDWYLFQLIVILKPGFNCWSNFALSWVDKVTIGTSSFVSVTSWWPC